MSQPLASPDDFRSPAERYGAWLLLLVAVGLRCAFPDWIEFRGDERLALLGTRELLEQGQWTHGLTASNGLVMGPWFLYLLAPVVALTHDPVLVTSWVVLLNLGALAVLGLLLRSGFGLRCAILGTALFAALPIGSIFARRLWAPDLVLPLVLPLICLILSSARDYARSRFLWAVALFAVAVQVHPSVWFLGPGLVLACFLLRLRPPVRDLGWAVGVALLVHLPWFVFECSTNFDDVRSFLHLREVGPAHVPGFWSRLVGHSGMAFGLTSATELPRFLGPARTNLLGEWVSALSPALYVVCLLATLWCLGRVVRALLAGRTGRELTDGDRLLVVLACVFVLAAPGYALLRIQVDQHYHAMLIPSVAAFVIVALSDLLRSARATGLTPLVGVLVLSQLALAREVRRTSLLAGGEGLFQPLGALEMSALRESLPASQDALLARPQHFKDVQQALAPRFDASSKVLWRLETQQESSSASGTGRVEVQRSSEGLIVLGSTAKDLLRLAEFEPATGGRAWLRLELSTPMPQDLVLFYSIPGSSEPARARVVPAWVPSGHHTLHIELPDARACGPLYVRLPLYRYVLHAAEVRELEP